MRIAAIVFFSWLLAEFYGYWLHVLMHSDRFRWLSHRHMHHHLKSYGPLMKMRTKIYRKDREEDLLIAGLGLEWFLPALALAIITAAVEWVIGLSVVEIVLSEIILIVYSVFLFWYLHDAMHVKKSWVLKVPYLNRRFIQARRNHDIHHLSVTDDGLMNTNFGIAFSFFDRIFGTYRRNVGGINKTGVKAAYERYDS